MLAIVSCTEKKVYETNTIYKSTTVSVEYVIESWEYTNYVNADGLPYDNNFFFKTVDVPELTAEAVKKGNIHVYRVYKDYQACLPEVTHFEEVLEDNSWNYFTQTVNFIYGQGWMVFDVTHSDFFYEDDLTYVPETMRFRVVITQ